MAISIRSSTHLDANTSKQTSFVFNKPSGAASGDVLYALFCPNDNAGSVGISARPSSWDEIRAIVSNFSAGGGGAYIMGKVLGGSEPSTYTLTVDDSCYGDLFCYCITGFAATPATVAATVGDSGVVAGASSTTSQVCSTLTSGGSGRIGLWGQGGYSSNGNVTSSRAGDTEDYDGTYGAAYSETGIGSGSVAQTLTTANIKAATAALLIKDVPAPATWDQDGFRFYNDDGSESAATAKAAEDTNISLGKEAAARLRVQMDATNDPDAVTFELQYRKVGDPASEWRKVPLS